MQNLAALLKALASVSWPAFAFTALFFLFRQEIKGAIGRIRYGKILGQEFELSDDLRQLHALADATAAETDISPADVDSIASKFETEKLDSMVDDILSRTTESPKLALIMLAAEIDKAVREAIATRGLLRGRQSVPTPDAIRELEQYGFPPNLSGSLRLFREVRSRIVHGHEATDDAILQAIDSGITILKAVNALPSERNVIYHPGVDIYSDEACLKKAMPAGKGVILETTSPDGARKSFRIFPTTKASYQKGKEVSWEWNMGEVWQACWYKDPDTGKSKPAWNASAEFVGRHLDDL